METPIKITKPISGNQSRIFNEQLEKSSVNRVRPEKKEQMLTLVAKILSKNLK